MKNFECYYEELRDCSIDRMFEIMEEMIDQYEHGKEEEHRRKLRIIRDKLENGMWSRKKKEMWVREQVMLFIGNVIQRGYWS